ncbi:hypothetical protein [Polaromonas sp.]|uniref:hypothetical protein n=1 Tax=Polaromonas sp. TaxID=1869339 RepID=UPI003265E87E
MLAGYSEEDLAGLSEAEKKIMLAGDDDDADAVAELAGEEDEDEAAAAAGTDGKGGKEGADKGDAAEKDADDEPGVDTGVTFKPATPADAKEQRDALQTRKDEAFQKLMDGEIEPAAFQKVDKEVSAELEKLMAASITDNVTGAITQANLVKAWEGEVAALTKTAKAEGLDYGDEKLKEELDGLVRVFGDEAGRKGMTDEGLKASKWALKQAHDTMKMRHGKATAAPAPSPAAGGKKAGAPDLSGIPPSLSKAPLAAGAAVADEFAHLEGLKGAALEKAIAKMTPEQSDRYLA